MTAGGALALLAQQYRRHGDLETGHFSTRIPSAQSTCAREPTHPLLRRFIQLQAPMLHHVSLGLRGLETLQTQI